VRPVGRVRGPSQPIRAPEREVPERSIEQEDDLVRLYLSEIGRYELLTKDDEARLGQAVQEGREARRQLREGGLSPERRRELIAVMEGGDEAEHQFVCANLRLVVSIAKRYRGAGLSLLDLLQEGNLGLMHAVGKFDWRRGFKFSTYATWWIRQAISRGVAGGSRTVRLPIHIRDDLARVQRAQARLESTLRRSPSVAELGDDLGMPEQRVNDALRLQREPVSLSEPLGEDEAELGDVVEDQSAEAPFDAVVASELPSTVAGLLARLDVREREILRLRFGFDRGAPRTLEEVGAFFQLTKERVRQIEAGAMSKLRHPALGCGARDLVLD
jgi:RNA polymerase sigma factor (sigma-70 family)